MSLEKVLILKKVPYKETSLIISGINPQFGRLDFIIRGGKKVSKKKFPLADLFREVEIEVKNLNADLQPVFNLDVINDYSALALSPNNYFTACSIAAFAVKNCKCQVACPVTYKAVVNAFENMLKASVETDWASWVKLVFLYESGFLALDDAILGSELEEWKKDFLKQGLAFAIGEGDIPVAKEQYWGLFFNWIDSLCRYHEL